ncbi:MAG: hypothetical protein GF416_01010 [Candidatus Altiarchaeales archaeon]|nr:hypothetical protein [Candidatus Altiarchaeales archaeon]MBD3415696.1 hypothetical protein [Candidatus Altiarchaeales archaeon]
MRGYVILAVLVLCGMASAEYTIVKDHPESVHAGGSFTVEIRVEYDGSDDATATLKDKLDGEAEVSGISAGGEVVGCSQGVLKRRCVIWDLAFEPGSRKNLRYTVKPDSAGGYYSAAAILNDDKGTIAVSNAFSIPVYCVEDGVCGEGEDFRNCDDCRTGSADGFCDLEEDGRVDPDCERFSDPDDTTTTTVKEETTTTVKTVRESSTTTTLEFEGEEGLLSRMIGFLRGLLGL